MPEEGEHLVDTVRVVGLRRVPREEPLGLTVKASTCALVIVVSCRLFFWIYGWSLGSPGSLC